MSALEGDDEPEMAPQLIDRDMTNARYDSAVSDLTLMGANSFESRGSRVDEVEEETNEPPKSSASSVQDSEASSAQDEEIKQAMAMALAIQNNPHLKPEEIHELLGQRPPPTVAPAPPLQTAANVSSNKQKAHRFTQMFNAGSNIPVGMDDTTSSQHSKTSKKYRANLTQMADRARDKFNGIISTTKSEDEGDRPDETSESQNGVHHTNGTANVTSTTVSSLLAFSKPEKPKSPMKTTRTLGEAWKRRGGLAKYSSSSPWERRCFYIADEKYLVYSALDKKTNESRGVLNLAESTVYASFGHSGAPSPFCLSISAAAAGETKWKISFDRHADQLEWLHVMTAITVRSSVDQYNTQLLAAADPGTEVAETYFHPPDSPSGMAAPPISSKSKQLWEVAQDENMMSKSPAIVIPTEEDHTKEKERALESAGKIWMLAQPKYILMLWNLGAMFARAVTLSSFWYILVLGNAAIVYLSSHQVSWQALVPFIRAAVPEPEQEEATTIESPENAAPVYIPAAGCSSVKLSEPTDPPVNEKGEYFAGWRSVPGSGLKVRSAGYSSSKQKIDSPGQLYDCVAVDIFESPQRYPDMAKRVNLPAATYANDPSPKTWRSPDIFIVSIALPTDPPKMGKSSSDGGGYTVTMYYRMREDTREILKRITGDGSQQETLHDPRYNAVRLFEEWIRRAPADPKFCSRFKVVPNAHNLAEIGMPSWISKYNGKPFLIKRQGVTGFLYTHPELSCVEFDVSLHPFPYLAKQGICFMKDSYFKKILVTFGFVIEGQSEDELPECVIGSMQLCYPDPIHAIQAKDFFAGTAQRSVSLDEDAASGTVIEESSPVAENNTD